jgi:hypothetical protein
MRLQAVSYSGLAVADVPGGLRITCGRERDARNEKAGGP